MSFNLILNQILKIMVIKNFAVLGYGNIGAIHLRNLMKHPKTEVKAVYSRSHKANLPKGINFYSSYEKLIEKEEIDAVLIATPTFTHKKIACFCAENGLDIFLEKPMALTLDECDNIINSVETNNVKFFIGHVLRFWPSYRYVRDFIFSLKSSLGDIHTFIAKRLSSFPWSEWFADEKKSGGVILDLSIHDLDYASWILGNVISISCKAKKIKRFDRKVFGKSNTSLIFQDDKKAKCTASWAEKKDFTFTTYGNIIGTRGNIEFNGERIFEGYSVEIIEKLKSDDGYYNELSHFIDCIINRYKNLSIVGEDGKNSVALCLAAIESANNNGKIIFLDEYLNY